MATPLVTASALLALTLAPSPAASTTPTDVYILVKNGETTFRVSYRDANGKWQVEMTTTRHPRHTKAFRDALAAFKRRAAAKIPGTPAWREVWRYDTAAVR